MFNSDHTAHCRGRIKDVAEILGYSLRYPDFDHGIYLVFEPETGGEVFIHFNGQNKGRLEASYSVPRVKGAYRSLRDMGILEYNESDPSEATFSAYRDPKQLARDIERRTVTPARELHRQFLAKNETRIAADNLRIEVAETLARDLGVEVRHDTEVSYFSLFDVGLVSYANVRVDPGGRVYTDRISFTDAGKALRLLAGKDE